jgi:hypothetical protein
MVKISAELIPLHKWIAYKAPLPPKSAKMHTIVIIYRTGTEIKYFYITSQVAKAEIIYRDDKDALVKIQKNEWPEVLFKEVSCIQCGRGHLQCIDAQELKKLYDNNQMSYVGQIPDGIKQKIKNAVRASITYNIVEQSQLTSDK